LGKKLHRENITTAREIERGLRWDGVTYSCAGMGNKIVTDYLKAHPEIRNQPVGQPSGFYSN
jgi:hypothetical protein